MKYRVQLKTADGWQDYQATDFWSAAVTKMVVGMTATGAQAARIVDVRGNVLKQR